MNAILQMFQIVSNEGQLDDILCFSYLEPVTLHENQLFAVIYGMVITYHLRYE